jgi:hypothetical protein
MSRASQGREFSRHLQLLEEHAGRARWGVARRGGRGVNCGRHLELLEELVHSGEETLWRCGGALDGGPSFVDDHSVGQVGGHDEVVLHDEGRLLGVHDVTLDHLRQGGEAGMS